MPVRIVQSKQNARLKELRRALANPGRERLVGIEGPNLLDEALRTGMRIACVFVSEDSEPVLDELRLTEGTEILLVPRPLLDAALTTETPQPVAALVETPDWTWAHVTGGSGKRSALIIILAGLQDPGNLGTILRSAEAFGATGAISLPGTVSAWNSKAVRASAGSVFRVPLISTTERECFEQLRRAGIKLFATTAHGPEHGTGQPANLAELAGPTALIIGNEGNGVPDALAASADARITIPCPGPVESLNAAVAASVLLYEASRQRTSVVAGGPPELRGARR